MIDVVVVDDLERVRQGLRLQLSCERRFRIVGEAGRGEEALAVVADLQPAVVIMDVELPGIDGITATAMLRALYPECSVLILTIHDDSDTRARALDAGASAFVEKTKAYSLVAALHQIVQNSQEA